MIKRQDGRLQGGNSVVGFANWSGECATRSTLNSYIRTNWSQDPFSYGSYSYLAKGSGNADRTVLAEPIAERVFFAGEALNPNYQSSTHAALESAMATCEQIEGTQHKRIAIVGAGMSGIAAAKRLADRDFAVAVFEGRDRIGGRILTDRRLGVAVDLGATWIHSPDGNPISVLADQADLRRVETDDKFVIRGKNGKNVWTFFAPAWLLEVQSQTPTGTELSKINMDETEEQFNSYGYGYKGRDVKFPNGYDEILQSLRGNYEVRLSTKITKIMHSQKGVSIGGEEGELSSFDAALVTVPLGVLKRNVITFEPALSQERLAAISRMGMGTLDKLYLKFEEPFWDVDATTILTPNNGLPRGHFNYWINFQKYLGEPIIMAFNAGESARSLSRKSDEDFVHDALSTLALAYPT